MKDIENRNDVINLVDSFYSLVLADKDLAPVFQPSLEEWPHHVERVYNFWENWLFQTGSYTGGMMFVHLQRHKTHPLTTELFEKWLYYWYITIDKFFEGKNADFLKKKALEIGEILNAKLNAKPNA